MSPALSSSSSVVPKNGHKSNKNDKTDNTAIGYRLDPPDWAAYRADLHQLVDACCDRMEMYRQLPWQPPPVDLMERLRIAHESSNNNNNNDASFNSSVVDLGPQPQSAVQERLVNEIMPYATGNTHPQFFGWVHGAGIPACMVAEIVQGTMNSNCGGRHHGAAAVERACIAWLCQTAGFTTPSNNNSSEPFGVLTAGTSQATIFALQAARTRKFGCTRIREEGIATLPSPVCLYASQAAHSCLVRAMECLGHGSRSVVRIPVDPSTGAMQVDALEQALQRDVAAGCIPLAIVGTAGSVTVGAFDDFNALADLAARYGTWFHVDAAFGFWTRCAPADAQIRNLSRGAERADSMALDAHKWPGVNYECGALLVRDKQHLQQTLAMRAGYLQSAGAGLAGGDVWFTDYSLDLSRGFRALKLWTALTTAGPATIGQVVADHCALAAQMGELVKQSSLLELAHAVISNICCFYVKPSLVGDDPVPTATEIAATLQVQGQGVFSTVTLHDKECLRAAIVNHRTTPEDIEKSIAAVEEAVRDKIYRRG